jgi:hypothetical protein
MALLKTAPFITSISGRMGGVYYKKDGSGQHVQSMPRHVYTTFGGQHYGNEPLVKGSRAIYINSWTRVASAYAVLMLLDALILFSDWARGQKGIYGKNKQHKRNLRQWFMHYNVSRFARGLPPYTLPPRSPEDLPVWTATGFATYVHTWNFYEANILYNGKPYFYSWAGPDSVIQWNGENWEIYANLNPNLPNYHWTKEGLGVEGLYLPDPDNPFHELEVRP